MLIEVKNSDLRFIEGAGVNYIKVGDPLSKFEDEECLYRVENSNEVDRLMDHYNIPSKYKDDVIKRTADNLSYRLGEEREEYLKLNYIDNLLIEELRDTCTKLKDDLDYIPF